MQFDLEKDRAYFEADEATGINERLALGYDLDVASVAIPALYMQIRRRLIQDREDRYNGRADYRTFPILQMIDADLHSRRPDLYLS